MILSVEKITKDFKGVRALNCVDCTIQKGHIHGLIGPNGSGKTTFFNVITGISPATEGKIFFEGREISGLKPYAIAKLGISRTFQRGFVAPTMTCLENVMSGAHARTKTDILGTFLRLPMTVSTGQIYTFFGTVVAVTAFMYLLYRTMTGRALRAMAQSPFVARLIGIPTIKMGIASYGIAGFLGGVTAVFLAMALGTAYPALGDSLGIKVIATALFAGLGNLKGGLICGLILGVAESLTTGYLPGHWSNAMAFGMIMVTVMFKPDGLFGARV